MIELVDLKNQLSSIRQSVLHEIEAVLDSGSFIQGKRVGAFEREFAELHKARHCIGCSSGTNAIFLALKALGIGSGDEVLTVPNTFIATAEAISHTGAKPVFVDVNPVTYNIDVSKIPEHITERTRAIIPVHLYGQPADMSAIMRISGDHDLKVVEDCAQAHLAEHDGRPVGSIGHAGAFSFYPGKNLGAYGDAGVVMTNEEEQAKRIHMLLNHGRTEKYMHEIVGYNMRMDEIQGAILSVKGRHLTEWTKQRQNCAALYDEFLKDNPNIVTPATAPNTTHVYHLYVIQIDDRQRVVEHLKSKGIATGIHYPVPLHLQPAYAHLGYNRGDFPVSERICGKILSLPLYPELQPDQITYICNALNEALSDSSCGITSNRGAQ